MAPQSASGLRDVFVRNRGLIFPILIVASVLVIVAPLPPLLSDLLLTCNITLAVVVLLTTIYVKRPLEFSVFPAILLGAAPFLLFIVTCRRKCRELCRVAIHPVWQRNHPW